jgi:hypothetical protein
LQDELFTANDHSMTGIMAASVARDDGKPVREDIDNFTFSLIAPLGAKDHCCFGSHGPLVFPSGTCPTPPRDGTTGAVSGMPGIVGPSGWPEKHFQN